MLERDYGTGGGTTTTQGSLLILNINQSQNEVSIRVVGRERIDVRDVRHEVPFWKVSRDISGYVVMANVLRCRRIVIARIDRNEAPRKGEQVLHIPLEEVILEQVEDHVDREHQIGFIDICQLVIIDKSVTRCAGKLGAALRKRGFGERLHRHNC